MESPTTRSAPTGLRIETSTAVLTPLDTETELPAVEAAQLSPKAGRVRHHLIPSKTDTCIRAPILKRNVSVPISSITKEMAAKHLAAAPVQDRVASNPLPTSFAAPRNLTLHSSSRHVQFSEAPPEEFYVLSGESYDRRPIKCTQGGSAFDMSLPPRCSSYNGDDTGEEEGASSTDEAASPVHSALPSAEEPAPDVGFFHDSTLENWACIKNGTVMPSVGYQPRQQQSGLMASGKSLHFSALSSLQHASALGSPDTGSPTQAEQSLPSQKVSLPVHGFRSFGGLQNSLAPAVTAVPTKQQVASPETTPPAPRHFSPDATPMPSPSLHKSIGAYASVNYFGIGSGDSQADTTSSSTHDEDLHNSDASFASDKTLGAMEVLRDASAPITTTTKSSSDFRTADLP